MIAIIVVVIVVIRIIKVAIKKLVIAYLVRGRTHFIVRCQAFLKYLFEVFIISNEFYVVRFVVVEGVVQWRLPLEYSKTNSHFILYFVERFHARRELEQYAAKGPYICLKAQYTIKLLWRHVTKCSLVRCLRRLCFV